MKDGVPVFLLQIRNPKSAFHIPGWLPRPGFNQTPRCQVGQGAEGTVTRGARVGRAGVEGVWAVLKTRPATPVISTTAPRTTPPASDAESARDRDNCFL
jgi:hypothetical protein